MIFLDADRNLLSAYPAPSGDTIALSAEEASRVDTALQGGVPAEVVVYGQSGEAVTMTFISAVADPATGTPGGVLLGRTTLDTNPILAPVVEVLRQGFVGAGTGFLIDDQHRILLDPAHPEQQERVFAPNGLRGIGVTTGGQAFRQRMPDGTSQLLLMLPVAGLSDWTVVVEVPNEVALALAVQISLPTLLLLLALAALSLPMVVTFVRRVAGPLEDLLQAADHIAEGQLDRPVEITGEDEVGRLGRAFEQMRVRLHSRLGEQERLLSVSRSVASSLELFRSMPTILSSALEVTRAIGVRIVLRSEGDRAVQTYSTGEAASAMAILDGQLMDLVERQGTVVISQLWRASDSLDTENLIPRIRALVALPLRSDTSYYGIMWLSYDHEHVFEESEMTFLSTLAGPAAVAVANARLFAEAEEGRRKLEALLESTADAVVAADVHGKIALINPAAKRVFGVAGEHVIGRRADEVIDVPGLAALMSDLQEPVAALELPHRQGKILLANTSTIVSHDGTVSGRVAVLRDITALKELDNIKTVFLRMVSHDLRSPLTYMRGYASMLPLSGPLNEKQTEALDRIYTGIDTISQMTERLTYLSRLQFGDEAELELTLVDVAELLKEVVPPQEALARQKDVAIKVEVNGGLPLLLADSMLYGHAIMNLINNAVKYTPEQGAVVVRVVMEEDGKRLTLSVTDTGIGIRPEDQARLFEAFYRVPQREGEAQRPRGTGLGLALVKAIAEAHGGSARVESEYGKGSTFTITLPVRNAAEV